MSEGITEQLTERITWLPARSVGTARVSTILRPRSETDMVFINLRNDRESAADLTADEFVFIPHGILQVGHTAEIIVKQRRLPDMFQLRHHLPPDCLVALRPFDPKTYGKITIEDERALRPIFFYFDETNRKNGFNSRAFFIRFFGANVQRITKEDITGPGQHL